MHIKDIGDKHWIGDLYTTDGWRRYTLYHIEKNKEGGSTSWPIAEIDVVNHPSQDGVNPHTEIKISLRNDIYRRKSGIEVDKNKTKLRHIDDIVEQSVLDETVKILKELSAISLPLSIWTCIRHVDDFQVEGNFWNDEG